MDEGGRVPPDQVDVQPSQALKGVGNDTPSRESMHAFVMRKRFNSSSHQPPFSRSNRWKASTEALAKCRWGNPLYFFLLNLS